VKIEGLIQDDPGAGIFRVNRTAMTAEDVLDLEYEHIFDRCWLYLGHESELPNPGDYLRRTVAGRPLMWVHGNDGELRVFYNTCTHRGAVICRQDKGNSEVFQCFYHAWSFNSKGELVGLPDEAGYGSGFDRAERALKSPPRLENYRGLCFVSFNPDVEDLVTYLAGAKDYIDLVVDHGLNQGLTVVPGSNQYAIKANWKLLVENSVDGYHVPVHQTYGAYIVSQMTGRGESMWSGAASGRAGNGGGARALGNGHTVIESRGGAQPFARWDPIIPDEDRVEIRARFADLYGEEWTSRISDGGRNLAIYPNLIINDVMGLTVRVIWPVKPDYMEVNAWALVPNWASDDLKAKMLYSWNGFLGPAGFGTPDDVEALESCQIGFRCREVGWSDISRGMQRTAQGSDELQMRGWWRQWYAQMRGLPKADRFDDATSVVSSR
jgi:p-cumate 2,3-dioxygenase subunit alpha